MRKLRNFKEGLLEDLKDQVYAQTYLSVALEEYDKDLDTSAFLNALRDVTEARGGITQLAKKTHLNRQNLYKSLSGTGDPKLHTIESVLHGLGFRLSVVPVDNSDIKENHDN
jgi:probable addiction module antidote protein